MSEAEVSGGNNVWRRLPADDVHTLSREGDHRHESPALVCFTATERLCGVSTCFVQCQGMRCAQPEKRVHVHLFAMCIIGV